MNILWDLRLFSYGYRDRGIGTYCRNLASAILSLNPDFRIFALGNRSVVPQTIRSYPITWIEYKEGSWKSSIWRIPYLVVRYKINLLHYWVALGPIYAIGVSPLTVCPAVATIYDLGVELWGTPHGQAVKSSSYWKMQKLFLTCMNGIVTISHDTMQQVTRNLNVKKAFSDTVYMPYVTPPSTADVNYSRQPYFITLSGGRHKNTVSVVQAFLLFRSRHPAYRLIILGGDSNEEGFSSLAEGITLEPSMEHYSEHLRNTSGLIFCSRYEGLGIPPLEAMQYGCPLLLSSIPPLRETCSEAGRFVDPCSAEDIAEGMNDLIADNNAWVKKSVAGARAYALLSHDAPLQCIRIYSNVSGVPITCSE